MRKLNMLIFLPIPILIPLTLLGIFPRKMENILYPLVFILSFIAIIISIMSAVLPKFLKHGDIIHKLLCIIFIGVISIDILLAGFLWVNPIEREYIDLSLTQRIVLNYEYGEKNINLEINDKNDFNDLIEICEGTAISDFSIPSCEFGSIELIFERADERVVLYPACDSCDTMRFGKENKFFYNIGNAERELLVKVLDKYGVMLPCV